MKNQDLDAASFNAFLARLSADAEQAGAAYEDLRRMLVKFFECCGQHHAEDLADAALNRAMRRVGAGEAVENLPGFCFGVAKFILLETLRAPERKRVELADLPPLRAPEPAPEDDTDARLACLRHGLSALPADQRELLLTYYEDEKRSGIERRQALADRLGIPRHALTKRVLRLREKLEDGINRCLRKKNEY
ncbi:MAG: RNA polymerase sigma factor [Blastocatellia bacterium]